MRLYRSCIAVILTALFVVDPLKPLAMAEAPCVSPRRVSVTATEALSAIARWFQVTALTRHPRDLFRNTDSPRATRGPRIEWGDVYLPSVVSAPVGFNDGAHGGFSFRYPRAIHWSGIYYRRNNASEDLPSGGLESGFGSVSDDSRTSITLELGTHNELRSVSSNLNLKLADKLAKRFENAEAKGLFGTVLSAMETKIFDRHGNKLKNIGPGGGGQGMFMSEQPRAVAEEGLALASVVPVFYDDILAYYKQIKGVQGTWDEAYALYLQEFKAQKLLDIEIPVGRGIYPVTVLYTEQEGVPTLQILDPSGLLFRRLYDTPKPDSVGAYVESIVLPLASIEIFRHINVGLGRMRARRLQPRVFHFNDWQTGLGPIFLKEFYHGYWPLGHRPAAAFTVHNLEYQGSFPNDAYPGNAFGDISFRMDREDERNLRQDLIARGIIPNTDSVDAFGLTHLDLAWKHNPETGMESWSHGRAGRHSFLKGAMQAAQRVVFVSEGHSEEAKDLKRGYGLDGLMRFREKIIRYVYNGIHAQKHRPENLKALDETGLDANQRPYAFRRLPRKASSMSGGDLWKWKRDDKKALQAKLGLEQNENYIVMGFVTRIVKQKGLNILMTSIKDEWSGQNKTLLEFLLDLRDPQTGAKLQIPVLGTAGDPHGEAQAAFFRNFLSEHPNYTGQFVFVEKFDESIAKQIGAGSDLMGMFSIDEPGGIANQEIALLLSFVLASNRGGLQDFKKNGGTPLELIPGFEIDNTPEGEAQRRKSAYAIKDATYNFLTTYSRDPRKIQNWLAELARFKPDWGYRAGNYVNIYLEAIEELSPGYIAGTRDLRAKNRRQLPTVKNFLTTLRHLTDADIESPPLRGLAARVQSRKELFYDHRVLAIGEHAWPAGIMAALAGASDVYLVVAEADVKLVTDNLLEFGVSERVHVLTPAALPSLHGFDSVLVSPTERLGSIHPSDLLSTTNEDAFLWSFRSPNEEASHPLSPDLKPSFSFIAVAQKDTQTNVEYKRFSKPGTPGAMGFWLQLGISDPRTIGLLEGVFSGLYLVFGFLVFHNAFVLGLWGMAGVLSLFSGHYYSGVLLPGIPAPVKKDVRLSLEATSVALLGFSGVVIPLVLKVATGHVWSGWLLIGIVLGGVLHAARNPSLRHVRARTLAWLRYHRMEGGLHTTTGQRGYKDLKPETLIRFAERFLDANIMPAVDRLDVLEALRQDPRYVQKPIAFVLDEAVLSADPGLADKAILAGATVLTGPITNLASGLRKRHPNVVLVAEVDARSSSASAEIASADAAHVDGLLLKPYGGWNGPSAPLSIADLRAKYPHLEIMVAGGVFQTVSHTVLGRSEALLAAVGFNAPNETALADQIAQYQIARDLARLMRGELHPDHFGAYFPITAWGSLPVDGENSQWSNLKALSLALHRHYPDYALALAAPLAEGKAVEVSFIVRESVVYESNPFESFRHLLGHQLSTVNSSAGGRYFKVLDTGTTIDEAIIPVPGRPDQLTEQHLSFTSAEKPGAGNPSPDCVLCAPLIAKNFEDELWVRWGSLNYYFNPYAVWPPNPAKDLDDQPYALVAAWNGKHRSQSEASDADVLRVFREQWLQLNASPAMLAGGQRFWLSINGWYYGDKTINGGASQDHIHAQLFRTPLYSQNAPVQFETPIGRVRTGHVQLLADPAKPESEGVQAIAFEVVRKDPAALLELDQLLSKTLKMITHQGHSFDVLFFETPDDGLRVFVSGRVLGRPNGALNGRGTPEILARSNIFVTGFERYYALTPRQSADLAILSTPRDQSVYLMGERQAGRLTRRPDSEIYSQYFAEIEQVTYSPSQIRDLLERLWGFHLPHWVPAHAVVASS
jgi:glycogen synthase